MKMLNKLNLVSLGDKQFSKQELINLKGGYGEGCCCGCGCPNDNDHDNTWANSDECHTSSIGVSAKWCGIDQGDGTM